MLRALARFSVAAFVVVLVASPWSSVAARSFGHATIVQTPSGATLALDGKPFFVYGAAFFYERMPRDRWAPAMRTLRAAGINTLDLYVPWNWHEIADGDFDFDGRTNPRRDLRTVLRLARAYGFALVVRPGPVVRNEWRNGGYPAWLLARPAYRMPAHDRLEGRYPPIATLQNAHSDDAAAAWMRNATHLRYARRWLERALRACAPAADRILAVALDDDQGAYIDNQTWPAPHLRAYLGWLRGVVRGATGPRTLVFINTYQMKVPASSPVWAMGNWYQSDAYAIGDHDRAQLDLSFGMLATRPRQPLVASEFQAGWLAGPGEARPRAADPSNTELALATMLGDDVRGVVNFPAQDTLAPSGWEAPFSNAFYAWDAAYGLDGRPAPRSLPTREFGALATLLGPELAASHVARDAAIAYLGGSFAPARTSNALVADAAAALVDAQRACRGAGLSCAVVDPHALDARELARYGLVIVPELRAPHPPLDADVAARLRALARQGTRVVSGTPTTASLARAFAATHRRRAVENASGATFAPDPTHLLAGFFSLANYTHRARVVRGASVALGDGRRIALPTFVIPAHRALVAPVGLRLARLDARFAADDVLAFSACMPLGARRTRAGIAFDDAPRAARDRACAYDVRLGGRRVHALASDGATTLLTPDRGVRAIPRDVVAASPNDREGLPIRNDARLSATLVRVPSGRAIAYRRDVYRDGAPAIVLDNGLVRVVVSPAAGARAFVFEDDATRRNAFSSVGGMRDDVAREPPLSTSDRIAKYTHDFPAGTFNRPYVATLVRARGAAGVRVRYDAPDVVPHGARYVRVVSLAPGARAFDVAETFAPRDAARSDQRAVAVTSLAVGDGADSRTRVVLAPGAIRVRTHERANIATGAVGYYDVRTHELATVAWRAGDVETATVDAGVASLVIRLRLTPGRTTHVRYGFERTASLASARTRVRDAGRTFERSNHARRGEVAERSTRPPQKRLSSRSCGFESHLPYQQFDDERGP